MSYPPGTVFANRRAVDLELAKAAQNCDAEGIDCALLKGANPRSLYKGWTPLHWAIDRRDATCIRILMEHPDTNFDEPESSGRSGLHFAASVGDFALVKKMMTPERCAMRDGNGRTPLMDAAAAGTANIVDLLLPLSDAKAKNENGLTAAMLARLRHPDIAARIDAFVEAVELEGLLPEIIKQIAKPGMRRRAL